MHIYALHQHACTQRQKHVWIDINMKLIFICVCLVFSLGEEIPVAPPTTPSSSTEEPSGEYRRESNIYFAFFSVFIFLGPRMHTRSNKDEQNIVEV